MGRLAPLVLAVVLAGSEGTIVSAQQTSTPGPSAKPSPTPKVQAYVRFWNMLIGKDAPDLQLMAAEDKPMTVGPSGNAFAGYLAVDPGTYNFSVRRPNDPTTVIKRLPIVLRGDVYVTLLVVAGKDGKPDVQIIDDTVNPKTDDGLGTLVIRQFFPGTSVTVGVNAAPSGAALTFGDLTTMEHLPLHAVVNMRAEGVGPAPKTWNVEADFASGGHHATMLVLADPYGRFRPRLVFDGATRKPLPPPTPPPGAPAIAHSPSP